MKITGTVDGQLDEKRMYLPGIVVEDICPKCGSDVVKDFSDEYLSYPIAGRPIELNFYHDCDDGSDCDWVRKIKLNISIEEVK